MLGNLMKHNQHPFERLFRVAFGMALLITVFAGPRTWWGLVGVIPLMTGLSGYCPLYALFGINTCRTSKTTTTVL